MNNLSENNKQFEILDDLFEPIIIVSKNGFVYYNKQAKSEFELNSDNNQELFFIDNILKNDFILKLFEESLFSENTLDTKINLKINNCKKDYYFKSKEIILDNRKFIVLTFKSYSNNITSAMYEIAKLLNLSTYEKSLFEKIHTIIKKLINAENFFVALYDEQNDVISFPYFVDEMDDEFTIIDAKDSGSLTAEVIRTGKPLLITKDEMKLKYSEVQIAWGTLSEVWLGLPLRIGKKNIGVIVSQSYKDSNQYKKSDIKLLEPVAEQIALLIGKNISEEELRLSEEKFKSAFKASPDAIAINRLSDGLYIEINYGFTQLTGFTPEETIGKISSEINIWNDLSDREKLVNGLKENGYCRNLKTKFRLKDGTIKYALMSANILILNKEPHILSITRDIDELEATKNEIEKLNFELEQRVLERTALYNDALEELRYEIQKRNSIQKQLEQYQSELAKALEHEKKSGSLKSRFISMVSHEYRTPLTVIYTSTELLDKFYTIQDPIGHSKHLDRIKQSVNNMILLLDDVLFVNKAENYTLNITKEIVNITEFLYTIIEEMNTIAFEKNEIHFEYSDEDIWMETDKKALTQIFNNLLSNAIKYSKAGSPIDIELINHDSFIDINIIDYGIGIAKDDYNLIFEHFYRGENVGTISGTGLGLSIVKRCVEALQGQITFNTEYNIGTTFNLKLPKHF